MEEFIKILEIEFQNNQNAKIALEQKAYMRNQFEFYGLKEAERRHIQKPFFVKEYLPNKKELDIIVKQLLAKPQRDFHYVA